MEQILEGDCRELLLDQKATVLITDPVWPNSSPLIEGHERPFELFQEMVESFPKTIKRAAVILGSDSDPRILSPIPLPFFRAATLEFSFPHYKGRILYTHDVVYFFGEPPKSRPGLRVVPGKCVSSSNRGKESSHPCPRKLEHMEWIIKYWTEEGDIVVDPFCGSGTTLVAAKNASIPSVGIEVNPEYCEVARERLRQGVFSF